MQKNSFETRRSEQPIKIHQNKLNIYTWGFAKYGQISMDSVQFTDIPYQIQIPLTKEISHLVAGEYNTGFITSDSKAYLFGLNNFGQLGNGNAKNKSKKFRNIPLLLPIKLSKISIGGNHVLGLSSDLVLYSWGLNCFGQLGQGNFNNYDTPTRVELYKNSLNDEDIKKSTKIIDIVAGPQHSLIMTNHYQIYSCGFSKNFSTGHNLADIKSTKDNNELEQYSVNIFTKINFSKILPPPENAKDLRINNLSAGLNHSGFIMNNKTLVLWGVGKNLKFENFQKFVFPDDIVSSNYKNFYLSNSLRCLRIGENFVSILTDDGKVFTTGDNTYGQLGIGKIGNTNGNNNTNNNTKIKFNLVKVKDKVIKISSGYQYTICSTSTSKVYGWGSNKYGQLPSCPKNLCAEPYELKKIQDLQIENLYCGGYHVIALGKIDKQSNNGNNNNKENLFSDFIKYPINKCLNTDNHQKREISEKNLTTLISDFKKEESSAIEKENLIKKLEKEIKAKEEVKKQREETNKNNSLQISDHKFAIEQLLDQEIKLEELVFPSNSNVGTGAFGDVKKAYWRKTLVCVKFLKPTLESKESQVIPFIEEFNLLKQLRHPNILLYIGGCISGPQHYLVTEFCENGNLFEFLHGKDSPDLDDIERLNLALEIAQGINYLHSFNPPILHRDLKSLNILLDKNYVVKIADFGWARLRNIHMTKLRGTFQWMAPEVIIQENYSEKADVYSFGIILWEFWSKDPPYKGILAKDVGNLVKNDKNYRPKIPKEVPEQIAELMKCCWDENPDKRPTFIEIINYIDEFLKNVEEMEENQ